MQRTFAQTSAQQMQNLGSRMYNWLDGNNPNSGATMFFQGIVGTPKNAVGNDQTLINGTVANNNNNGGEFVVEFNDSASEEYEYYTDSSSGDEQPVNWGARGLNMEVFNQNVPLAVPQEYAPPPYTDPSSGMTRKMSMAEKTRTTAVTIKEPEMDDDDDDKRRDKHDKHRRHSHKPDDDDDDDDHHRDNKHRRKSSVHGRRGSVKHSSDKKKDPELKARRKNALRDPKIRRQLASMQLHPPNFLALVTLVQLLMMAYALFINGGMEPLETNFSGGPSRVTLIQLGAKFGACMKPKAGQANLYVPCHSNIPLKYKSENGSCLYYDNLLYMCGMGGFAIHDKPDQVWRFITPTFIHYGLASLFFTLAIQIRIGFKMEQQMGSLKMGIIYLISSVCGTIFSTNMNPDEISAGATGSLFGLIALLYLDLLQNWPIILNRTRNVIMLTLAVLVALSIGLLPFFDNYTHLGGFAGGLLSGLIFMPHVYYNDSDKRKKLLLRIVAIPILLAGIGGGLYAFIVDSTTLCPWCKWLDCVPPDSEWCSNETGSY